MVVAARLYHAALEQVAHLTQSMAQHGLSVRVLIQSPCYHPDLVALTQVAVCQFEQGMRGAALELEFHGLQGVHDVEPVQMALVFPSKQKQQSKYWIAKAWQRLEVGGVLLLCCENQYGAKSYDDFLALLSGNARSSSKSKTRLVVAMRTEENLADEASNALLQRSLDEGEMQQVTDGFCSQPGLFSWDRIDVGSAMLMACLPSSLAGVGLDLCCGYGVLSRWVASHCAAVEKLYLLDVDQRALACAEKNMAKFELPIAYLWLDAAVEALPTGVDFVVCNPPFHSGQSRDVQLGQTIVARACQHLKKGGLLYLVANRQLPYEQIVKRYCPSFEVVKQASGFKVIKGVVE
ncbi:MAG: methyltransferase [Zetaproteobacteria bacterium]|nr:methyltransferase [Zetaproteobacteria bacterium]